MLNEEILDGNRSSKKLNRNNRRKSNNWNYNNKNLKSKKKKINKLKSRWNYKEWDRLNNILNKRSSNRLVLHNNILINNNNIIAKYVINVSKVKVN